MTIYFAGSIRGGRGDIDIYMSLITELKKYGSVFTEHVGVDSLLESQREMSSSEIYERDMEWLTKADIVVAEVTQPSLGVGYELGQAEAMKKPVLCLYRALPERHLSAMIHGNPALTVRSYVNLSDAYREIQTFCETYQHT